MITLLKKELKGAWRTYRLAISIVVLLAMGLVSPLLAKYTPLLLSSIPDLPAGFADLVPEPSVQEAITQYVKNISQFGVLLVIVLNMGAVAGERERGTVVMLLTRPVRPASVILAKWLAGTLVVLAGLLLAALGCALYTLLLFGSLDLGAFLGMNVLMLVFLSVYLTLTILASTLAPSQSLAAAGAFSTLIVMLIVGALPRIADVMPGELLSWGQMLFNPPAESAWVALGLSVCLIAIALVSACVLFERREI